MVTYKSEAATNEAIIDAKNKEKEEEKTKKLAVWLDYLDHLKVTNKIELTTDAKCLDAIFHVHEMTMAIAASSMNTNANTKWLDLFIEKRSFNVWPKLISAFLTTSPPSSVGLLQHKVILIRLIAVLNVCLTRSSLFCLKFLRSKRGLVSLSALLNSLVGEEHTSLDADTNARLLVPLVANFNVLSRYAVAATYTVTTTSTKVESEQEEEEEEVEESQTPDEQESCLYQWRELRLDRKLLDVRVKEPRLTRTILQTIINVAGTSTFHWDENENEDQEEIGVEKLWSEVVPLFRPILERACKDFAANTLRRVDKEFIVSSSSSSFYSIQKFAVHLVQVEFGQVALTNLLWTLYRLTLLCPARNAALYTEFDLKANLRRLLDKASLIESVFCLKLIAQLLFVSEIRNDFLTEVDFLRAMHKSMLLLIKGILTIS